MCNLETEGAKYGCGHYVITHIVRHIDCGNRFCTKSSRHPPTCPDCTRCVKFFGPDAKETVTATHKNFCAACTSYYLNGSTGSVRQKR